MKIEGVKDVQFVESCPLIEQATREGWTWSNPEARVKFYQNHGDHIGVEVLYKDGSSEKVDIGDPSGHQQVKGKLGRWGLRIHLVHLGLTLPAVPSIVSGLSRVVEANNPGSPQILMGFMEMVPAVFWLGVDFVDWHARLRGPKLAAEKYSKALSKTIKEAESNVKMNLNLA